MPAGDSETFIVVYHTVISLQVHNVHNDLLAFSYSEFFITSAVLDTDIQDAVCQDDLK